MIGPRDARKVEPERQRKPSEATPPTRAGRYALQTTFLRTLSFRSSGRPALDPGRIPRALSSFRINSVACAFLRVRPAHLWDRIVSPGSSRVEEGTGPWHRPQFGVMTWFLVGDKLT